MRKQWTSRLAEQIDQFIKNKQTNGKGDVTKGMKETKYEREISATRS